MRNLKKILALVLAMIMTLSVMATANAALTDLDSVDASYDEAVKVLTGLGVFEGRVAADGSTYFAPEGTITRQEVAAILYRIDTGRVGDNAAMFVEGADFADVKATDWAAGYIGYCANGGLVQGYNGKFNPTDKIDGYQVLAMILRAIGYGKNNEFTGPEWQKNVAAYAQELGILKGLNKDVVLSQPATREVVAQILFKAIADVDQVEYTNAFNYQPAVFGLYGAQTIGEEIFGLRKVEVETIDNWGRPGYYWYADEISTKAIATITKAPTATYFVATTECDIAAAVGLTAVEGYTLYNNGKLNKSTVYVQPTDTVGTFGAQGTQLEVYGKDRIVMIDTLLAKVTSVAAASYDAAGHMKTPATIKLDVFDKNTTDLTATSTSAVTLTNGATNYTYAKGDYVLVNAYMNNTTGVVNAIGTDKQVVEIKGVASAVAGVQTFHWFNANQRTIDGTNYMVAKWFELDQATDVGTIKYNWFFDEQGNVIGAVKLATSYTYGILENIQWINPVGANGYAQATIRYMDGTTETKVVTKIGANTLAYTTQTAAITADNEYVSTSLKENAVKCGNHLYEITTSSTGTVSLKHVNYNQLNTAGTAYDNFVAELNTNVTLVPGTSAITGTPATTNGKTAIYTNTDTVYMVQTFDAVTNAPIYTIVTGFENVAKYTTNNNVMVDYVNLDSDVYAEYVYITGTSDNANSTNLFYLTSDTVKGVLSVNGTLYYVVEGYVDGIFNEEVMVTADAIDELVPSVVGGTASYKNEMFGVTMVNGKITSAVIKEWADTAIVDLYTNLNSTAAYTGLKMIKFEPATGKSASWNGEVLAVKYGTTDMKFTVLDLKPVNADAFDANMSGKEIYVIYTETGKVENTYVAKAVYVATPAGTATADPTSDWTPDTKNGHSYEINFKEKKILVTNSSLTLGDVATDYSCSISGSYWNYVGDVPASKVTVATSTTADQALGAVYVLSQKDATLTFTNNFGTWTLVLAK